MQAINWLALKTQETDLKILRDGVHGAIHVRKLCQMLVEAILQSFPWDGRDDLIPFYHPSQTYQINTMVALPLPDQQHIRPMVWYVAKILHTEECKNPVQGVFQVLTLDVNNKKIDKVADIPGASYITPVFSDYTTEDLSWLSTWVTENYAKSLLNTIEDLVHSGHLFGKFIGETFLPNKIPALAPDQLMRFFENLSSTQPWVSAQEMLKGIPELADLSVETSIAIINEALETGSFRSLGGGRWTTSEMYTMLNREVPRGLPVPHIHSRVSIWTEQDNQIFARYKAVPEPDKVQRTVEEDFGNELYTEVNLGKWIGPSKPIALPTLNYLHITQSYFPVDHVRQAFHPDIRLVFVQFIEGEHQPFLFDRDSGMLKALDPKGMRTKILNADPAIPAGTHLWLEYQGSENYRIAPRQLPTPHKVPCKLASIIDGKLHIEYIEIPMYFEGDPSVFKAELRFEDIEALFAEATLSVLDALIEAVQELCASDPQRCAYRLDIFNAVFIKRMCSPNSVEVLLYSHPNFIQLGEGYFRYEPNPEVTPSLRKNRKRTIKKPPHRATIIPRIIRTKHNNYTGKKLDFESAVETGKPEHIQDINEQSDIELAVAESIGTGNLPDTDEKSGLDLGAGLVTTEHIQDSSEQQDLESVTVEPISSGNLTEIEEQPILEPVAEAVTTEHIQDITEQPDLEPVTAEPISIGNLPETEEQPILEHVAEAVTTEHIQDINEQQDLEPVTVEPVSQGNLSEIKEQPILEPVAEPVTTKNIHDISEQQDLEPVRAETISTGNLPEIEEQPILEPVVETVTAEHVHDISEKPKLEPVAEMVTTEHIHDTDEQSVLEFATEMVNLNIIPNVSSNQQIVVETGQQELDIVQPEDDLAPAIPEEPFAKTKQPEAGEIEHDSILPEAEIVVLISIRADKSEIVPESPKGPENRPVELPTSEPVELRSYLVMEPLTTETKKEDTKPIKAIPLIHRIWVQVRYRLVMIWRLLRRKNAE